MKLTDAENPQERLSDEDIVEGLKLCETAVVTLVEWKAAATHLLPKALKELQELREKYKELKFRMDGIEK